MAIVKTVKEFCDDNTQSGTWPSSEHAVRAIIQQGDKSPFASAVIRYRRRVLIDTEMWSQCLEKMRGI